MNTKEMSNGRRVELVHMALVLKGFNNSKYDHFGRVTIEAINGYEASFEGQPLRYGVNWAGCGVTEPDLADEYSKRILQACKICDKLNALGMTREESYEVGL